jgi:EpsI family protein
VSGLQALPVSVGSFRVIQAAWDDPYKDPKADTSVSQIYWGDEQKTIELFVGYRASQNGGERISSPKLILPEHWNFEWIKPALVEKGNGASIQGNWMLTRSGSAARLVLYWYEVGGKTIAGELSYRIEQARRSIFERRSDGAAVRLATPVAQDESVEQAQQRLLNFSSVLYPELARLLPQ